MMTQSWSEYHQEDPRKVGLGHRPFTPGPLGSRMRHQGWVIFPATGAMHLVKLMEDFSPVNSWRTHSLHHRWIRTSVSTSNHF